MKIRKACMHIANGFTNYIYLDKGTASMNELKYKIVEDYLNWNNMILACFGF